MNLLDMMILALMVFFILRGVFRGFFREIGSLAGVIIGIWLANVYQLQMTDYLAAHLPSGKFLALISFAVIFFMVLILCNLLCWCLNMIFKKACLSWADRTLGMGLAVLKGIIITYLLIILLTFFLPSKTPLIAGSRFAPWIVSSYQSVVNLIAPGSFANWKKKFLGNTKELGEIVTEKVQSITR
jgi:membrane protein required for colicin V production